LSVNEPSGSDTFTITLDTEPSDDVTINLSTSNGECTISPTSVTLGTSNWDDGEDVEVTAVDDSDYGTNPNCIVKTASATSNDSKYNNKSSDDVTVTVEDDELPPPPEFGGSTPVSSNLTHTSFSLVVQLDSTGKVYYVVVPQGATAPTATEVKMELPTVEVRRFKKAQLK
jgi:hypothetical protein